MTLPLFILCGLCAAYPLGRLGDFFSRLYVRFDPWSEA
ncbi:hypothetical protein LMG6103_03564 [Achromobacter piechaudii]|nr:hypothetical protein LMG6103_03564 [Achromobacter piechaudii]